METAQYKFLIIIIFIIIIIIIIIIIKINRQLMIKNYWTRVSE